MRALVAGGLIAFALALAGPSPAQASCDQGSCGVPSCWTPSVKTRPDMAHSVTIYCSGAVSARLLSGPAHGDISNVSAGWNGLQFDLHEAGDAPRFDEAVFEVTGHEGSIEQRVDIEVVPLSENSPPACDNLRLAMRSDGREPVDLTFSPYCRDPDGDDVVIEGGGPGVHTDSPRKVASGVGAWPWHYRTATVSGSESTTIWATDSLGARSPDATVDISVGPGVNTPPECGWGNPLEVAMRPGVIRNFGIVCTDAESDPFTAALTSPPERGTMARFDSGTSPNYASNTALIDATYVPADASLEPDPFDVTLTSTRGDTPVIHAHMVPRALPDNGGMSCGWSPMDVTTDRPAEGKFSCSDAEGDPLTAELIQAPRHGTAAPPTITPARYGEMDIHVPYVPNPGYEGYDCVKVRISDGYGSVMELSMDIEVSSHRIWPVQPPVVVPPVLPFVPPPGDAPPEPVRSVVERALGTTAVKRVRKVGRTQVWARSTLSRRDLVKYSRAPGLVVVCGARCRIRSDARLSASGLRAVRASRSQSGIIASAGQPQQLSMTVARPERRVLGSGRKGRANFTVKVTGTGLRAIALKHSIPVSR